MTLLKVFEMLYQCYGPQRWWPADTPFEVMVGAVLTQNTAWLNVERAIANLKANNALDAARIVAVRRETLAGWIRPAGYFNVKAQRLRNFCRWYLDAGDFAALNRRDTPVLRDGLLSVNGVGAETADDMLLYAFKRPVFVVDAYTRRIFSRLDMVDADISYEELREYFELHLVRRPRGTGGTVALYNEFHALIVNHGKNLCRKQPRCGDCCLRRRCPTAPKLRR